MKAIFYLFSGFFIGMGQILPMSPQAHEKLLNFMAEFDSQQYFLQFLCHTACLAAIWICLRHRIAHLFRELRLFSKPARQRRRAPDLETVLDGKFLLTASIPMLLLLLFRNRAFHSVDSIPVLTFLLTVSGIILYLPQFSRSANRDGRHMSRKDSLWLGICVGLSCVPGLSGVGIALSICSLRGMDKRYALESVLLLSIPALLLWILMDLWGLLSAGLDVITLTSLLFSLLAATAAFFSSWICVFVMRFLAVNTGYGKFAYYNWGLAIFGFILYLMV